MSLAAPKNPLTAALLILIVLLLAIIAAELFVGAADNLADSGNIDEEDISLPSLSEYRYIAPQISDFPDLLGRPVFFPDRKLPAEPEPELVAATPLRPLRLQLEGIAISSDSRIAALRNTSNNELLHLAEGMSNDGWRLESVSADRAVFERGSQVTELRLDAGGSNGQR